MSEDERYEGFANFFTFCVWAWVSNDEKLHGESLAICKPLENELKVDRDARFRKWITDMTWPHGEETSLRCDFIKGALAAVDWREVCNHIDETREDIEKHTPPPASH